MFGKREQKKELARAFDEKATFGDKLDFASAEAYKLLRTNILFALPDEQKCRVVGVTSSCSGEGKSTTALNLAYMLAEANEQVLLIEADMRLPTIAKRLDLNVAPGLSNVLAGLQDLFGALQKSGIQENLYFISAGDIPPNPSELLGSKSMAALMEALSGSFDFVILDLPPVTEVSDALVASKVADGMVVVVRQNYANRRALADTMQQLNYAEAKVLGFVMTRSDAQKKGKKYYKKTYGSYGKYSSSRYKAAAAQAGPGKEERMMKGEIS